MCLLTQRYKGGETSCRNGADEGPRAGRRFCSRCHSSASIGPCTSSNCNYVQAHRNMAADMNVHLYAYPLSQQIRGSVVA